MKRSSVMGTKRAVRVTLKDLLFRGFLVFVVLLACVLWYFLSASSPFYHKSEYWIEFRDILGLKKGNEVLVNGKAIGQVREIVLNRNSGQIWVRVSIPEDLPLPKSTRAGIYVRSLVGEKALDLRIQSQVGAILRPGDTLQGIKTVDPTQLMTYFYQLSAQAQTGVRTIQDLNQWLDSTQLRSKGDSLFLGLAKTSHRLALALNNLQGSLGKSKSELLRAKDTVQALGNFVQGHPAWKEVDLLMQETQSLKNQLLQLKQRDEKLWLQSAPRSELSRPDLRPQIDLSVRHLDSLYSILRQSRLELNPDFF